MATELVKQIERPQSSFAKLAESRRGRLALAGISAISLMGAGAAARAGSAERVAKPVRDSAKLGRVSCAPAFNLLANGRKIVIDPNCRAGSQKLPAKESVVAGSAISYAASGESCGTDAISQTASGLESVNLSAQVAHSAYDKVKYSISVKGSAANKAYSLKGNKTITVDGNNSSLECGGPSGSKPAAPAPEALCAGFNPDVQFANPTSQANYASIVQEVGGACGQSPDGLDTVVGLPSAITTADGSINFNAPHFALSGMACQASLPGHHTWFDAPAFSNGYLCYPEQGAKPPRKKAAVFTGFVGIVLTQPDGESCLVTTDGGIGVDKFSLPSSNNWDGQLTAIGETALPSSVRGGAEFWSVTKQLDGSDPNACTDGSFPDAKYI